MTPYEIDILLHYHCRGEDHEDVHRNPPVWRPTIDMFLQLDLLRQTRPEEQGRYPMVYTLTERGHAYCAALEAVPLPDAAWIVRWPAGNQIQLAASSAVGPAPDAGDQP